MSEPRVLLFGLGAIGSVYACILGLSKKCSVSVVARSNYAAVSSKGLNLKSPKFGDHESIVFDGVYKSCEEAASSGTFDYVLCASKALLDAKPSLEDQIRPVVTKEKTSVVILQNGVGAEAPLHAAFPDNTIVSAVVWTGGRIVGDGKVEQFNREGLTIGVDWRDGGNKAEEQQKLDTLVGILRAGGGDCNVVESIQSERWVKVIWNACWNSVTTATQLRTNRFLDSSPQALKLSYAIMNEVAAVAVAKGLDVPEGTVDKLIKQCTDVKEGLPSSMLFDHMAQRPMEVEVILGTPLKEGERLGVPVPSLTALYCIVKALDWKNAHPHDATI